MSTRFFKKMEQSIIIICYAMVSQSFAGFVNPANRGPNFDWDNFPEMMKSYCGAQIFLHIDVPDEHKAEVVDFVKDFAFEFSTTLVKIMKE